MRLVLVNFEMDELSDVLAYQCKVARELARHVDFLLVLTEKIGAYEPADNMHVEQLPGRPLGVPRALGGGWAFAPQAWSLLRRHRIDACFVHMNMRWTYWLQPALTALGIPTLLWYCHGSVHWRLKLAAKCAAQIISASTESCRVAPEKLHAIGHGIDTELFRPLPRGPQADDLLYVGRISPRKRQDLLIDALAVLRDKHPDLPVRLRLVGPPLTAADREFEKRLRSRVWDEDLADRVRFEGFVPMRHMPRLYPGAFAQINVSQTNSVDKGVLEALACGVPVLTSNVAFFPLLEKAGLGDLILRDESPAAIADRVAAIYTQRDAYLPECLRDLIVGRNDLTTYVQRILTHLEEIRR
jgi:glycosyltransferase involved in cell wall biosynthesis